jgi:hypothetical protein
MTFEDIAYYFELVKDSIKFLAIALFYFIALPFKSRTCKSVKGQVVLVRIFLLVVAGKV